MSLEGSRAPVPPSAGWVGSRLSLDPGSPGLDRWGLLHGASVQSLGGNAGSLIPPRGCERVKERLLPHVRGGPLRSVRPSEDHFLQKPALLVLSGARKPAWSTPTDPVRVTGATSCRPSSTATTSRLPGESGRGPPPAALCAPRGAAGVGDQAAPCEPRGGASRSASLGSGVRAGQRLPGTTLARSLARSRAAQAGPG